MQSIFEPATTSEEIACTFNSRSNQESIAAELWPSWISGFHHFKLMLAQETFSNLSICAQFGHSAVPNCQSRTEQKTGVTIVRSYYEKKWDWDSQGHAKESGNSLSCESFNKILDHDKRKKVEQKRGITKATRTQSDHSAVRPLHSKRGILTFLHSPSK
jgi:hypothetical protein